MSISLLRKVAPPAIALVVIVVAWQLYVVGYDVRPQLLPSPARVVEQGWAQRGALARNAAATLQVTFAGFGVSLVVSWTLAVAIDFSAWLRRALVPLFVTSQTIPIIVIAPLMITWFGFG